MTKLWMLSAKIKSSLLPFKFLSYPQAIMDKIKEMGEGIKVQDPPVHKTTKDEFTARGKRSASAGEQCTCLTFHLHRLTTSGVQVFLLLLGNDRKS